MLLRTCRFVSLVLTALLLGTSFAHVLERPAKLQYPASLYVTLQQTLYVHWGPPSIGGFLEPLVEPANAVFRAADPSAAPRDWRALRAQWELGHSVRFVLHLLAFSALAFAATMEGP